MTLATSIRPCRPSSGRIIQGDDPSVLSQILGDDVAGIVWTRRLPQSLARLAAELTRRPPAELRVTVTPGEIRPVLDDYLPPGICRTWLIADIAALAERFRQLFALERVALRLTPTDRTSCPRFHTDRVPCRLLTTYVGPGTEWLPQSPDSDRPGQPSLGLPDGRADRHDHPSSIRRLNTGEVALFKGTIWRGLDTPGASTPGVSTPGVSTRGVIHRSPHMEQPTFRLLLALDSPSASP